MAVMGPEEEKEGTKKGAERKRGRKAREGYTYKGKGGEEKKGGKEDRRQPRMLA